MAEAGTVKAVTVITTGMWALTFLAMISAPTSVTNAFTFQAVCAHDALAISRAIFIANRYFAESTFPQRLASYCVDVTQTLLVGFVAFTMFVTVL